MNDVRPTKANTIKNNPVAAAAAMADAPAGSREATSSSRGSLEEKGDTLSRIHGSASSSMPRAIVQFLHSNHCRHRRRHECDTLESSASPPPGSSPDGGRLELLSVQEIPSAQQQMWIVTLSSSFYAAAHDPTTAGEVSPSLPPLSQATISCTATEEQGDTALWNDALVQGQNRIVIRLWKGASRWWNLNHHDTDGETLGPSNLLRHMARQEVLGYICARQIFDHELKQQQAAKNTDHQSGRKTSVRIPRLFHFSEETASISYGNDSSVNDAHIGESTVSTMFDGYPWAIFEYVGPESTIFVNEKNISSNGADEWMEEALDHDNTWVTEMIRLRSEFGFVEPHPRWGRVPEQDCLQYGMSLLESVILPIHVYCLCAPSSFLSDLSFDPKMWRDESLSTAKTTPHQSTQYSDMVALCKFKYATNFAPSVEQHAPAQKVLLDNAQKLKCAIAKLETLSVKPLPPVLCHMDYQPQNLVFGTPSYHKKSNDDIKNDDLHPCNKRVPVIVSVLDWEDAAFADLRFDLIMVCRKVCANRIQANVIWETYQEKISWLIQKKWVSFRGGETNPWTNLDLGSIEPWLLLETVHSITTLLLQVTAGGGRNSWETQQDLWGKIEREFHRFGAIEGMEKVDSST